MTPWTAVHQASLSFIISWSLLRFMSIESIMLSNHLILCPLLLLPSIFPSNRLLFVLFCFVLFSVSWLFTSGGQRIRASASASVLPTNIWGWFPLRLTGLFLWSTRDSRVFSSTTVWKHQSFGAQFSLWSNSHIHSWKNHSFDYADLCQRSEPSAF